MTGHAQELDGLRRRIRAIERQLGTEQELAG
jgi:hypothetical protein